MRKIAPIALNAEQMSTLSQQLGVQEVQKAAPKSRDPKNFPVFEVPINKKVLIYVPDNVYTDAEGVEHLSMDAPLLHSLEVGKRFYTYRCISGLVVEGTSFDGECPICDGCAEPWDLANLIIKEKCEAQGLDPEDKDAEAVKSIRTNAFSDRVVKDATRYYTFPIAVFETVNDDGKTLATDDDGNLKYQLMWYTISETQWGNTWAKTLEGMEDEPTHPGGRFFLLNYCYTPKRGEPNKRDSAKALVVSSRKIKNSEVFTSEIDKVGAEWTPEKARETVISHAIYSYEDLLDITNDALESTRNMLALYNNKEMLGGNAGIPQESKFTLEEKKGEDAVVPLDGGTDLDME